MRLSIHQRTSWHYQAHAEYAAQVLRLTPRPYEGLRVLAWQLRAHDDAHLMQFDDAFGNISHMHAIVDPHDALVVEVEGVVETADTRGIVRGTFEPLLPEAYLRQTSLTVASPQIVGLAAAATGQTSTRAVLLKLMELTADKLAHRPAATSVHTTAAAAIAAGGGVCQDHAHVFVSAARCLGIPARYVGGYLCLDDADPVAESMRAGQREEAGHAWAEAFDPDIGWLAFDPARCTVPGPRHVRISVGLDYASASPVRAVRRGRAGEELKVGAQVERLGEQ